MVKADSQLKAILSEQMHMHTQQGRALKGKRMPLFTLDPKINLLPLLFFRVAAEVGHIIRNRDCAVDNLHCFAIASEIERCSQRGMGQGQLIQSILPRPFAPSSLYLNTENIMKDSRLWIPLRVVEHSGLQ